MTVSFLLGGVYLSIYLLAGFHKYYCMDLPQKKKKLREMDFGST